jgi:dipeptidyl aminopeptidase/acylaminoacyl peptidase
VHGGPWARDAWGYQPEAQFFANRGYAVLQVNYRGSTGFGKAFQHAAEHEFAGKMHDDLIDGVNWVISEGLADPERIGIYGGSYGGYATLVGVTFTPDVFRAAVSYVGPSSLITLIKSFPAYWKPFLQGTWFRYVGDPDDPEQLEDLKARSPIYKVDQIKTPLLVIQGANDPRVTKVESDQIVEALKTRGVDVEYMVKDNEGHGFLNADNRIDAYSAMEKFFAKHLGGRSE